MNNISVATAVATFYGQFDFIYTHVSLGGQDFLRLLTSKLGTLKFASINVKSAVIGASAAVDSFISSIDQPNENCLSLTAQLKNVALEISSSSEIKTLNSASILKTAKHLQKWKIYERIGDSPEVITTKAKILAGAYLLQILSDSKVATAIPSILIKLIDLGLEGINNNESRSISRLELNAKIKFDSVNKGEKKKPLTFNQLLPFIFRQKIDFADIKTRQGVLNYKTFGVNEFLDISQKLRSSCETRNVNALKIVIGCFLGIPLKFIDQVKLLNEVEEDWKLVLDLENGVVKFDLEVVAEDGAKPRGEEYLPSNKILVKPLPEFALECLRYFQKNLNPHAKSIGELLGLENKNPVLDYNDSAKFINSFARIAINHTGIDAFESGLIANDFRVFPSAKIYYNQTSRQTIWKCSEKLFVSIGWGIPTLFCEGLNFGSEAVLGDTAISTIFSNLAEKVTVLKPSNNCSLERLLMFHDAYTVYSASLAVFCLSLRESKIIKIYSDDVLNGQNFILFNDKPIHGNASTQPVTVNVLMQQQFELYGAHCHAMVLRIEKHKTPSNNKLLKSLNAICDHARGPLFVTTNYPLGISTAFLKSHWPANLVENFGRHFWETNFQNLGISSRESSAHLRHQTAMNLNWSASSDFVLDLFLTRISNAQVKKLNELKITTLPGLTKRLK